MSRRRRSRRRSDSPRGWQNPIRHRRRAGRERPDAVDSCPFAFRAMTVSQTPFFWPCCPAGQNGLRVMPTHAVISIYRSTCVQSKRRRCAAVTAGHCSAFGCSAVTPEPLRDGPAMAHHPTQELADPSSRPRRAIASHPGSPMRRRPDSECKARCVRPADS